jgi:hypothetical protein
MSEILGFANRLVPTAPTDDVQYEIGDIVATFNTTDYFTIGCNLLTNGLRINGTYHQTLCKIPITAAPGSQITYTPKIAPRIPANELIGQRKTSITLWLTDNTLKRVNTNGESFSATLIIHYIVENSKKIFDP